MFKKIYLITISLIFFTTIVVQAQTVYVYSYDNNGNRITRTVVDMGKKSGFNYISEDSSLILTKVYPNPVENELFVSFDGYVDNVNYVIFNLDGKVIKKGEINDARGSIDFSSLPSGSYFMTLYYNGKKEEFKIINL